MSPRTMTLPAAGLLDVRQPAFKIHAELGVKHSAPGPRENGKGSAWFGSGPAASGSKSPARKMASAMIAKIPLALARHIARVYRDAAECAA